MQGHLPGALKTVPTSSCWEQTVEEKGQGELCHPVSPAVILTLKVPMMASARMALELRTCGVGDKVSGRHAVAIPKVPSTPTWMWMGTAAS